MNKETQDSDAQYKGYGGEGEHPLDWENLNDLLELAWGLLANAHGGDWDLATLEWKKAAEQWRDKGYHPFLNRITKGMDEGEVPPDTAHCPKCGGVADNGTDRIDPPNPYFCKKCAAEMNKIN